MITVRGTNVYPSAIENILYRIEGASDAFQLVLTRETEKDSDEITVRIEPEPEHDAAISEADLADKIRQRLVEAVGLRMAVEVVPIGSLPRSELKAKRIQDDRPTGLQRELDRG